MPSKRVLATMFALFTSLTLAQNCKQDEFECGDGRCIPVAWHCDYEVDCNDGSDELGCESCEVRGYSCRLDPSSTSGEVKCIPPQWRCDNWNDCPLRDDELFCAVCNTTAGFFACNDNECLTEAQRCDWMVDCYGGEDEADCPYETCEDDPNAYRCGLQNETCVHQSRVCDGVVDCPDAWDECTCEGSQIECVASPTQSPTTPAPIDAQPVWKWCPESNNMVYLGFTVQSSVSAKDRDVPVFWSEPTLRSNPYFSVVSDSGAKPGDKFKSGQHSLLYRTSCDHLKKGTDEYELCQTHDQMVCTVELLVFWNMSAAELAECSQSTEQYRMRLVADSETNMIMGIHDDGVQHFDNPDESVELFANAKYMKSNETDKNAEHSHKCYATVEMIKRSDGSTDDSTNSDKVSNALTWMIDEVWPFVLVLTLVAILLCFVIGCLVFLYKRTQDYEDLPEYEDSYSEESMELYDPYTGQYAHEIAQQMPMAKHRRHMSEMHPYAHIPAGMIATAREAQFDTVNELPGMVGRPGGRAMIVPAGADGAAHIRRHSEAAQRGAAGGRAGKGGFGLTAPTADQIAEWRAQVTQERGVAGVSPRGASSLPRHGVAGMRVASAGGPRGSAEMSQLSGTGVPPMSATHSPSPEPSMSTAIDAFSIRDDSSARGSLASGRERKASAKFRDGGRRHSILGVSTEDIAFLREKESGASLEDKEDSMTLDVGEEALLQGMFDAPSEASGAREL